MSQTSKDKKLSSEWFIGISNTDTEAKEEWEKFVRGNIKILDFITKRLEKRLDTLKKNTKTEYDSPSWAYLQAHKNGRIEELENLLTLTKL